MKPALFYSWQNDSPSEFNRYYLREIIQECLKKLNAELVIEDEIRFDSDSGGVAGTPDLAATIFDKLRQCECAVFDVTAVSRIEKNGVVKLLPNPNVLIELGFAAHAIGWDRVICIINTVSGSPHDLPFDLRSRRHPIVYSFGEGVPQDGAKRNELIGKLASAIRMSCESLHHRAQRSLSLLNRDGLTFLEIFGPHDYFSWDSEMHSSVIDRLLELELLWCNSDSSKGTYAYHWTRHGRLVYSQFLKRRPAS